MRRLRKLPLRYKNNKSSIHVGSTSRGSHYSDNNISMIFLMICIIIIVVSVVTSYAWFWSERSIQTVAQIATPIQLYLSGGHQDDIEYINLGGIDTTIENGEATFVFSVHGKDIEKYDLQLVHTTNIPFTYEIYNATEVENGEIIYISPEGNKEYRYELGNKVGGYLNRDDETGIADSMKDKGYEADDVQKNAYPLFYLKDGISTDMDENSKFLDYYVLKLSWTGKISSNKETDMVYLMVGVSEESIDG